MTTLKRTGINDYIEAHGGLMTTLKRTGINNYIAAYGGLMTTLKRKGDSYLIIIKKDWQCNSGRGGLTPYQSEDHSPTLPTYRGKDEKRKIVEDKKGESN